MTKRWQDLAPSTPNREQMVHERELARISYSPPKVDKTAWWVVASEHMDPYKKSWHWDWFFSNPSNGKDWGGPDWVTSTHSYKHIEQMRKGDIVVAYQAYEKEIVGLVYLESRGKKGSTGQYDTFDLLKSPIVYFPSHRRTPYKAVCSLSQAKKEIEFCSDHVIRQGTVFEITQNGFDIILSVIIRLNASQESEIREFLAY